MGLLDNLLDASNNAVKLLDDHKDKILLVGGLAAGAGTVFFASRATLKSQKILEDHKTVRKNIEDISEEYGLKDTNEHKLAVAKTYASTGCQLAKMYAPAVVLGATSVACIIGEHCVMQNKVNDLEKTVAGLSAAYIAVDQAFKAYRKRVVAKYGEKEDRYFRFGETEDKIEVTELKENGKTKTHKETIKSVDDIDISDYAKFFDATCDGFIFQDAQKYKPDWDRNISFLQIQQHWANVKLKSEGYLFLNDVYESLGIPKTQAGQVVGWIYDPNNPLIDSQVSFGIFEPRNHRTINGYEEECILLDFNVDGVIIDKIKKFALK